MADADPPLHNGALGDFEKKKEQESEQSKIIEK